MKHTRYLMTATALAICGLGAGALQAQSTTRAPAPAYVVVEFKLTDPEGIKPYAERAEATFKAYGGRLLVRGGTVVPLEGVAPKPRVVIIAFDSLAKARAWYGSPAYAQILPIRLRSGEADTYIVEGVLQ
jgi:uncharacterized protein (DUF1330 family)